MGKFENNNYQSQNSTIKIFFQILFMLIMTVVIPLFLGGIRLALRSPDLIFGEKVFKSWKTRVIYSTLAILLTPIQIVILYIKLYFTDLTLKAYPEDKMLLEKRARLTFELKSFS